MVYDHGRKAHPGVSVPRGVRESGYYTKALLKLDEPDIDTVRTVTFGMQGPNTRSRLKNRLKPGEVLNGKWEILEHIESGGKGDVYVALQKHLERKVAVKVFSPGLQGVQDFIQEELEVEKERFHREVIAMAGIRHSNVLQIYDYDEDIRNGRSLEYLAMELAPSATLRISMKDDGFRQDKHETAQWISDIFLPVLEGVNAIHAAGIIHRDLKPENIMLDGIVPKITDFGSARLPLHHGITRSFHILGTLSYMSKEQFEDGSSADARADIYSLGKLLFEAVQGKEANNRKFVFKQASLPLHLYGEDEDGFFARLDAIIRGASTEDLELRTASVDVLYCGLSALVCSLYNGAVSNF